MSPAGSPGGHPPVCLLSVRAQLISAASVSSSACRFPSLLPSSWSPAPPTPCPAPLVLLWLCPASPGSAPVCHLRPGFWSLLIVLDVPNCSGGQWFAHPSHLDLSALPLTPRQPGQEQGRPTLCSVPWTPTPAGGPPPLWDGPFLREDPSSSCLGSLWKPLCGALGMAGWARHPKGHTQGASQCQCELLAASPTGRPRSRVGRCLKAGAPERLAVTLPPQWEPGHCSPGNVLLGP